MDVSPGTELTTSDGREFRFSTNGMWYEQLNGGRRRAIDEPELAGAIDALYTVYSEHNPESVYIPGGVDAIPSTVSVTDGAADAAPPAAGADDSPTAEAAGDNVEDADADDADPPADAADGEDAAVVETDDGDTPASRPDDESDDDAEEVDEDDARREEILAADPVHSANQELDAIEGRISDAGLEQEVNEYNQLNSRAESLREEVQGFRTEIGDDPTEAQQEQLDAMEADLDEVNQELRGADPNVAGLAAELREAESTLSDARTASLMSDINAAGGFLKFFLREGETQRMASSIARWAGYDEDDPACPGCVQFFHNWGYDAWADAACRTNLKSEKGMTFVSRSGYTSFSVEGEKKPVYPCGSDPDTLGVYDSGTGIVTLENGTEMNCAPYLEYKITGSVVPAEVAMEFDVYLNGDDDKDFDETRDLHLYMDEDNETLRVKLNRSGDPWALMGSDMFIYQSYYDFDKVCLKFTEDTFSNMQILFSGIGDSGLLRDDDNPYCNKISSTLIIQTVGDEEESVSAGTISPGGGTSPGGGCVGPNC